MRLGIKIYEIRSLLYTKNNFIKMRTINQIIERNKKRPYNSFNQKNYYNEMKTFPDKEDALYNSSAKFINNTNVMKQFSNFDFADCSFEKLKEINFEEIINKNLERMNMPYIKRKLFQRNFTNFFLFANIYINEKNKIVMIHKSKNNYNEDDQKFYQFLLLISSKSECNIISETTLEEIETIKFNQEFIEKDIERLEDLSKHIKQYIEKS